MKKNKNSEQLFFKLLRAGLFLGHSERLMALEQAKRQSRANDSLFKGVDWNVIYQLACEQSVQGQVLQGIEELRTKGIELSVPKVLLLQWIGEVQMIEQRNKEMNGFIAELIEKLRKDDIYALLVKGQGVAQCYEKPLWRSSGDIDLFLSDENYVRAKNLLIPNASVVEVESVASKHFGMTINDWVVELHGKLYSSLSHRINKVLKEIMDDTFYRGEVRSWQNHSVQVFLLGIENDVIYTFTHFLGHYYKGGIGLRQICDWCRLLWTYREKISMSKLEKRINDMRLMSEWKAFCAFAVDYLGMPVDAMPFYSSDTKWKKKAKIICTFILEVGNFGHNRDNSYYSKSSFLIRKIYSFGRRCGDLLRHARIFPMDSLRFFPSIAFNGVRSALRGE